MHPSTPSANVSGRKPLTFQDFVALTKDRLHATLPGPGAAGAARAPSDFDLNPGQERDFTRPDGYRAAAVLIPIVARSEPQVLLTQRTSTLSKHAGQIAFPGGTVDTADGSPQAAALRETREEIGLSVSTSDILGYLDCYRTGTGYLITPVVACIEPGFELVLNPREVASSFEVPLAFLLDPANHVIEQRTIQGRERHFHAIPYQDR